MINRIYVDTAFAVAEVRDLGRVTHTKVGITKLIRIP